MQFKSLATSLDVIVVVDSFIEFYKCNPRILMILTMVGNYIQLRYYFCDDIYIALNTCMLEVGLR